MRTLISYANYQHYSIWSTVKINEEWILTMRSLDTLLQQKLEIKIANSLNTLILYKARQLGIPMKAIIVSNREWRSSISSIHLCVLIIFFNGIPCEKKVTIGIILFYQMSIYYLTFFRRAREYFGRLSKSQITTQTWVLELSVLEKFQWITNYFSWT